MVWSQTLDRSADGFAGSSANALDDRALFAQPTQERFRLSLILRLNRRPSRPTNSHPRRIIHRIGSAQKNEDEANAVAGWRYPNEAAEL